GGDECTERARESRHPDGYGTSEGGSYSGTGDCRSELRWRVSGKELSQRRWQDDLYIGASRSSRRRSWPSGAGIRYGTDAAGRVDSAGCVCQPRQPVRGTRRRPWAGGCSAAGAWIEPQSHSAAGLYGSGADFTRRRRCRTMGQYGAVARAERVAANSTILLSPCACESGRKCLSGSFAVVFSEWIPLWRGPGEAGSPHQSILGHQVGVDGQNWGADYGPRPVPCRPDCHLCIAGHFFVGRRAWTGALAAGEFRSEE